MLGPAIQLLEEFAGGTEEQFLKLGSQFQDFSLRSSKISSTANDLTELVTGSGNSAMSERLVTLFSTIEAYLDQIKTQGSEHFRTLEQILVELDRVVEPLQSFQKMDKALKMLSISTKIESSRLGELGAGFITLAMDVEKLSSTVNEKSAGIMGQRQKLSNLIGSNIEMVRKTEEGQYSRAGSILSTIRTRIDTLQQLNEACSSAGSRVKSVAEEVSEDIGTVVSSMQFHDITRQQIEHVVEALEKLKRDSENFKGSDSDSDRLAVEAGDICELQAAQLRHAEEQLFNATVAILDSLKDIAQKQAAVTIELQQALMGNSGTSDRSQLDMVQRDMHQVTEILNSCTMADQKLNEAMTGVTDTISEICNFVSDIEAVGSEIDLIALNAQIKAAHTGPQGAALGVLAEAIKRLSLDAVVQTESVSKTLKAINELTANMEAKTEETTSFSLPDVKEMENECKEIIDTLGQTNMAVIANITSLAATAESLADDINATTSEVSVHERSRVLSNEALTNIDRIIAEARAIQPASNSFRDNLLNMEKRYTMESERMIHEMMAARHGVTVKARETRAISGGSTGLGDNVDLF